jgi:hypothetical protein
MTDAIREAIKTHLEYLGYSVTIDADKDLLCSHRTYFNFVAREIQGGLILRAGFGPVDENREAQLLPLINQFNALSLATIAYVTDKKRLGLSGWYPLPYEKAGFTAFFEVWHKDQGSLVATPVLDFLEQIPRETAPSGEPNAPAASIETS